MNVTQRIVGTGVALVIVVGGYGCRYALREATDDTADRIARNAVEDATERYEAPSIPVVTTPTTTEPAPTTTPEIAPAPTTTPTPTTTPALPKGWPAELPLAEGLVVESTTDVAGLGLVGTVAGDVATITTAVRAQLAPAGFTVDETRSVGGVVIATGAAGELTVLVSAVPEDPATSRVTYRLQLAG